MLLPFSVFVWYDYHTPCAQSFCMLGTLMTLIGLIYMIDEVVGEFPE